METMRFRVVDGKKIYLDKHWYGWVGRAPYRKGWFYNLSGKAAHEWFDTEVRILQLEMEADGRLEQPLPSTI